MADGVTAEPVTSWGDAADLVDLLDVRPCGEGRFVSSVRGNWRRPVVEGGQIVERGTHTELLAKQGRYRQLYDKQYHFEADRFINPGEDFTPAPPKTPSVPQSGGFGSG